jgi:mxaA protein
MSSKFLFTIILFLLSLNSFAENESPITIELANQRNYGYSLGDEIVSKALINTTFGYQLEKTSIPKPGPINSWLALTRTQLKEDSNGYDYQLRLYYQAFKSIKQSTQLTIPAVELRFDSPLKSVSELIPAWDITYNPLIPGVTPDNQVNIQGPLKPEYLETSSHYPIIFWLILLTLLLSLYLAWIYDKLPLLQRYTGPFGRSCKTLAQLSVNPDSKASNREAILCFHQAINECAEKTVFTENLTQFFQKYPQFSEAKLQTEKLFNYSRQLFFSQSESQTTVVTTEQILSLCQLYRKIERGSRWS